MIQFVAGQSGTQKCDIGRFSSQSRAVNCQLCPLGRLNSLIFSIVSMIIFTNLQAKAMDSRVSLCVSCAKGEQGFFLFFFLANGPSIDFCNISFCSQWHVCWEERINYLPNLRWRFTCFPSFFASL